MKEWMKAWGEILRSVWYQALQKCERCKRRTMVKHYYDKKREYWKETTCSVCGWS